MMAHAVANYLKRKLLLINYPALQTDKIEELMKLALREAKIQNAVVFFDEVMLQNNKKRNEIFFFLVFCFENVSTNLESFDLC